MTATVARTSEVERVLGRPVWRIAIGEPLEQLAGKSILITGGAGSIGQALYEAIQAGSRYGWMVCEDVERLDVRDPVVLAQTFGREYDFVFHLAGAKHAPEGECDPFTVARTNVDGTMNVLEAATPGARVVFASTCKACDPETAYGASKLIAERMVLNAGGTVARFHNVVETSGNVFEIWRGLADDEPLPVAPCVRHFIALEEAVALLLWCAVLPPARYAVNPGEDRAMWTVAEDLYPGRARVSVDRRRGDRRQEPLVGSSETVWQEQPWLLRITSPHEAVAA